jgi:hypothetical protein
METATRTEVKVEVIDRNVMGIQVSTCLSMLVLFLTKVAGAW